MYVESEHQIVFLCANIRTEDAVLSQQFAIKPKSRHVARSTGEYLIRCEKIRPRVLVSRCSRPSSFVINNKSQVSKVHIHVYLCISDVKYNLVLL